MIDRRDYSFPMDNAIDINAILLKNTAVQDISDRFDVISDK
jgi:hypothetical protein